MTTLMLNKNINFPQKKKAAPKLLNVSIGLYIKYFPPILKNVLGYYRRSRWLRRRVLCAYITTSDWDLTAFEVT